MDIIEAIRTRRSIGKVTQEPVAKETIEQILDAAVWAPNHRLTEPWRFFVLSGEGRGKLGEALAAIATAQAGADLDAEALQAKAEDAKKKALRAPVVIAVAVVPAERKDVIELEEYGPAPSTRRSKICCSTIHALGLGAVWRSGEPCYHRLNERSVRTASAGQDAGLYLFGRSRHGAAPSETVVGGKQDDVDRSLSG